MAKIWRESGVVVLELEPSYDSVDMEAIERLQGVLAEVAKDEPVPLLMDMSGTTTIGARFLGLLFSAGRKARQQQRLMALCHVNSHCADILQLVRADAVFKTYPTRRDALRSVLSPP